MTQSIPPKPKKLLDQLRDAIRIKHYSYSTEKMYVHWAKRYILFHKAKQGFARHPADMGVPEIEALPISYPDIISIIAARHVPTPSLCCTDNFSFKTRLERSTVPAG